MGLVGLFIIRSRDVMGGLRNGFGRGGSQGYCGGYMKLQVIGNDGTMDHERKMKVN